MTHFLILTFFLWTTVFYQTLSLNPSVVLLTNARRTIHCHNLHDSGIMTMRCGANEKIRMLDAFDVVVRNKSQLPLTCLFNQPILTVDDDHFNEADCKIPTSFTSACTGRENCTVHMQRMRLNNDQYHCHNEFVDYTIAFYECVSDAFIYDVCSSQSITSAWGTLQTPNFPNPYTSNDDCWCKLSTQFQHRIFLSVVVFQLIPDDQQCATTGLYLQSSQEQRSTQCTYLQQGQNYLSDSNVLYMNFYSRISTVRGGFWIIYEANNPHAEVHLHCGSREKIGVPYKITPHFAPFMSTGYNSGWNSLKLNNNPVRSTTVQIMQRRLTNSMSSSTSPSMTTKNNRGLADGAFTYPYGSLTTFELAYGPRGWYLKFPFGPSNATGTKFLQTTTTLYPIVKWNSTWRYTRKFRTRVFNTPTMMINRPPTFTTKRTSQTTIKPSTLSTATKHVPATVISPELMKSESSFTTRANASTTATTTPVTIAMGPVTGHYRILQNDPIETHLNSIIHSSSTMTITTATTATTTIIPTPSPSSTVEPNLQSTLSLPLKTLVPVPTPWYPPAGPFDWWHWKWYSTKFRRISVELLTTTVPSISIAYSSTTASSTTTTMIKPSTKTAFHLSNTTQLAATTTTTTTNQPIEVTPDWFKWPLTEPVRSTDDPLDYFDDPVNNPGPMRKDHLRSMISSTASGRSKVEELDFLPTRTDWKWTGRMLTMRTSSGRRQTPSIQTVAQTDDTTIATYGHSMLQHGVNHKSKKNFDDPELLSQTDMTIVVVSILFVVLLAIINLILFAVRRHRHQLRTRHLLSGSFPSLLNDRSNGSNNHSGNNGTLADSSNHLIDAAPNNNNNNNDILPAVGEIVLWDEKDQGGYTIDNEGAWAKIEGNQWFGGHLLKNYAKTSFTKSFRSRFRFMSRSEKKAQLRQQSTSISIQSQVSTSQIPVIDDSSTVTPAPETTEATTSIPVQTKKHHLSSFNRLLMNTSIRKLIPSRNEQNEEYQRQMETTADESNYATMHGNGQGEYSLMEDETDRSLGNEMRAGGSVIISVPTMFRRDDDAATITEAGESIYHQHFSMQSPSNVNSTSPMAKLPNQAMKSMTNPSIIVGHCRAEFQPLDPKLFLKATRKPSPLEHTDFEPCSQSFQISSCDSGFVDDSNMDSIATTSTAVIYPTSETNMSNRNPRLDRDEHFPSNDLNRSFPEQHSTIISNLFEIYDRSPDCPEIFSMKHRSQSQITVQTATSASDSTNRTIQHEESQWTEERKQRQEIMNQVLASLRKKRVYFQDMQDSAALNCHSRQYCVSSPLGVNRPENVTKPTNLPPLVKCSKNLSHELTTDSVSYTKRNLPLTELYTYPHSDESLVETRF